jgi:hypothetical protein
MNDNLKLLTEAVALFDEDSFYSNSYNAFGVTLQGAMNSNLIQKNNQEWLYTRPRK